MFRFLRVGLILWVLHLEVGVVVHWHALGGNQVELVTKFTNEFMHSDWVPGRNRALFVGTLTYRYPVILCIEWLSWHTDYLRSVRRLSVGGHLGACR